jgi:hypothetical protein
MEYPKFQIDLLQAVQDMRDAQRSYFNQPCDFRLKLAKVKEQKVDQLLKPYENEGLIRSATKTITNTKSLFD